MQPDHPNPCSVCGRPAVASWRPALDSGERWLCYDHLPPDAREMYDALRESDWAGEPANDP
jgi:hypothetical protein